MALNGEQIPSRVYAELKVGDAVKFGFSTRQYVLQVERYRDLKKAARQDQEQVRLLR